MKNLLLTVAIVCSISAFAQNSSEKHHRIVMQLTSNDTMVWKMLMRSLRHLEEGWGNKVEVEVVAFGPGVEMVLTSKSTEQKQLAEYAGKGVKFVACENTLRLRKLTKADLLPAVSTVPMGIGEVVLKQEDGWSYIKAGY